MKEFFFDMPCGITIIVKAESLVEAINVDSKYDLSSRFRHVDSGLDEPLQVLLPEMTSVDEDCLSMVYDMETDETLSKDDQTKKFQALIEEYKKSQSEVQS